MIAKSVAHCLANTCRIQLVTRLKPSQVCVYQPKSLIHTTGLTRNAAQCKYKVAVIGSGPAGFYTTQQLLKNPQVSVDIYEKFPVPFGLVRFGVAPDHQEVKNVINSFTKVALNERTRFVGNVAIGSDVTLNELRHAYHAVVLCYGSSQDATLNIPGEDLANVFSARRFVGWYNGIPQDKDLDVSLDSDTAVIIGQGNVALDCARILLQSTKSLKSTDITNHALRKISKSKIRRIYIVGRRGPLQAAFKIKEFRELTKMDDCQIRFEWTAEDESNLNISTEFINSLPRSRKRLVELYKRIIDESNQPASSSKECILKFFASPVEILSDGSSEPKVKGIRLRRNLLDDYISEKAKIIETEDRDEVIDCDVIIRSIGYRSTPIDQSLPFDHRRGVILNQSGRVVDNLGLYCSGWAAFGATGVIINTMNASFEVGKNILEDINRGKLDSIQEKEGYGHIEPLFGERNAQIVNFVDWQRIDQYEREIGQNLGKPREKVVSVEEILDIKRK